MPEDSEIEEIQTDESTGTEEGTHDQPDIDPDTEARARSMGWAPKDEWRGSDDRWVDAEAFVKRGEEIMPILRANLRKLETENAEIKKTLADFSDHHTKTEQRMYAKAIRDISTAQRQAAEEGNLAQYDYLEKSKQAVVREATSRTPVATAKQDDISQEAIAWRDQNSWFTRDQEMATFATSHHEMLLQTRPGMSLTENLEEVTKTVKRAFPERFSNPKRSAASAVEGGGRAGRGGGKGYGDLPADAKQACDKFVKQGLLTKEEYCKDFFTE
jgi:hypothetical protein